MTTALAVSGSNQASVNILSGATYATGAQLASYSCSSCGGVWTTKHLNVVPCQGQSVKLKVSRTSGTIGIDSVRAQVVLPALTTSGAVGRGSDATQGAHAVLDAGGTLTTGAVTVDSTTQYGSVVAKVRSASTEQCYVYVLSGVTYTTSTQVTVSTSAPDS